MGIVGVVWDVGFGGFRALRGWVWVFGVFLWMFVDVCAYYVGFFVFGFGKLCGFMGYILVGYNLVG